ncbi:hypothetical protein GUITHDRAFT_102821 [Guillardia theta CCMP2712]|uniref:EGF-like domain-containing protein n=1 Tax=Guillardia theta (strain CCMP2712) TaxID=905079 RepID=L1JTZ3_GUITC|nr:hypothetical protein GUITHDRAFT_102821 [Guillardia theta CCMP2712]EKX51558.1 hypothetical protein GUITHDRAFT_102821 [Guillardia theta CCMP2712]|eukprot:XP_005838538.1 hypothetical protein GUITHDRAFT_102821 [Guillardia theta CCMP2712]
MRRGAVKLLALQFALLSCRICAAILMPGTQLILAYDPSIANLSTNINLLFQVQTAGPATKLQGFLMNFSDSSTSVSRDLHFTEAWSSRNAAPAGNDTLASVDRVSWNKLTYAIEISFKRELPSGFWVDITISSSNGIRLPERGLLQQDSRLTFSGATCISPAVGSFLDIANPTELRVSGDKLGQIIFRPHFRIFPQDKVIIDLPDFYTTSETSVVTIGGTTESWSLSKRTLTIQFSSTQEKDVLQSISVWPTISIPVNGLLSSSTALTISCDCAEGPVTPTPFVKIPDVVGYIAQSSLKLSKSSCLFDGFRWQCEWKAPRVDEASELVFAFKFSSWSFLKGDPLRVKLEGFGGERREGFPVSQTPILAELSPPSTLARHPYGCPSNAGCASMQYAGDSLFSSASWDPQASLLVFTASKDVPAQTSIVLVVSSSAGLRVPTVGLWSKSPVSIPLDFPLNLSTSVLQNLYPVMAYRTVSLSFSPLLPNRRVELVFRMQPWVQMQAGENITLLLPGFVAQQNASCRGGREFLASFNSTSSGQLLVLFTLLQGVLPLGERNVSCSGLLSPPLGTSGLVAMSSFLPLSRRPSEQRADLQFILPPLLNVSLTFSNDTSSDAVALLLSFNLSIPLVAGDRIELLLPGFKSQRTSSVSTDTGRVQYDGSSQTLSVTLTVDLPEGGPRSLLVPQSANMFLPLRGLEQNDPSLRWRVSMSKQEQEWLPLYYSQRITQRLDNSSVSFLTPRAGQLTDLLLTVRSFEPYFKDGTSILLLLPGFPPTSGLTVTGADKVSLVWNASSQQLTVTILQLGAAADSRSISLLFRKVQLPPAGVDLLASSSLAFSLLSDGRMLFPPQPFTSVGLVGALLDSRIDFFPRNPPGSLLGLNLAFTPGMQLLIGETLEASWKQSSQQLILTASSLLPRFTPVDVVVPSSSGIRSPSAGIASCAAAAACPLRLSSSARSGPVLSSDLVDYQPLGYVKRISVAFSSYVIDTPVSLSLSLSLSLQLAAGDQILLYLPSFSSSLVGQDVSGSFSHPLLFLGPLAMEGGALVVTFIARGVVAIDQDVSFLLSSSLRIFLPPRGIRRSANQLDLLVRRTVLSGPVDILPRNSLFALPLLFSFDQARVSFDPPRAGPVSISFLLNPAVPLAEGDTIHLLLPQFRQTVLVPTPHDLLLGSTRVASWRVEVGGIAVQLLQNVTANSSMQFLVNSSEGFLVPLEGILADSLPQLKFQGQEGKLDRLLLSFDPVQAALLNMRMTFLPAIANTVASVTISFVGTSELMKDDVISFSLAGFTRQFDCWDQQSSYPQRCIYSVIASSKFCLPCGDGCLLQSGTRGCLFTVLTSLGQQQQRRQQQQPSDPTVFNGAWLPSTSVLLINTNSSVAARIPVSVLLPAALQLVLPAAGVSASSPLLYSLSNRWGDMKQQNVPSRTIVAAFLQLPTVQFGSHRAGLSDSLLLSFTLAVPLLRGDLLILQLLDFLPAPALARSPTVSVSSTPAGLSLSGSWNASSRQLTFSVELDRVEGGTPISLLMAQGTFILPYQGLRGDENKIFLQIIGSIGVVDPSPVSYKVVMMQTQFQSSQSVRLVTAVGSDDLSGDWRGETVSSAGYVDYITTLKLGCISISTTCPAIANYDCNYIQTPTHVQVAGENMQVSTQTSRFHSVTDDMTYLLSGSSSVLTIKSKDNGQVNVYNSSNNKNACLRYRALRRVNLEGDWDTILEMQWPSTFLAIVRGTGDLAVRLRFKLTAIKQFSPFGLELATSYENEYLKLALADIAGVSSTSVSFTSDKYPPVPSPFSLPSPQAHTEQQIEQCNQLDSCNIEAWLSAETVDQKTIVSNWIAQISKAFDSGDFNKRLSVRDLFATATLNENPFPSKQLDKDTTCPPGMDLIKSTDVNEAGMLNRKSADCLTKNGALDGDNVQYDQSYTVTFTPTTILLRNGNPPSSLASATSPPAQTNVTTTFSAGPRREPGMLAALVVAMLLFVAVGVRGATE